MGGDFATSCSHNKILLLEHTSIGASFALLLSTRFSIHCFFFVYVCLYLCAAPLAVT